MRSSFIILLALLAVGAVAGRESAGSKGRRKLQGGGGGGGGDRPPFIPGTGSKVPIFMQGSGTDGPNNFGGPRRFGNFGDSDGFGNSDSTGGSRLFRRFDRTKDDTERHNRPDDFDSDRFRRSYTGTGASTTNTPSNTETTVHHTTEPDDDHDQRPECPDCEPDHDKRGKRRHKNRFGEVIFIAVPTAEAKVPFCTGIIWETCCKQDFGLWRDGSGHVAFKTCRVEDIDLFCPDYFYDSWPWVYWKHPKTGQTCVCPEVASGW